MHAVESQTPTFLFTDIEGSTRRWETHGDAMADALAGDRYQTAEALSYMGGSSTYLPENRAGGVSYLEAAHRLIDSQPAPRLKARIKHGLAIARHAELKIDVARRLYEEALELFTLTGQGDGPRWNICASLGELAFLEGDVEKAIEWSNKSVDGYRALHDSLNSALALSNLAAYEIAGGRFDDGLKHGREAVARFHDLNATIPMAFAIQHVATALALDAPDTPKTLRAAHLLGFAGAQYQRAGIAIEHTERQGYDRARASLCERLGDEAVARIMDESKSWTDDQAALAALQP